MDPGCCCCWCCCWFFMAAAAAAAFRSTASDRLILDADDLLALGRRGGIGAMRRRDAMDVGAVGYAVDRVPAATATLSTSHTHTSTPNPRCAKMGRTFRPFGDSRLGGAGGGGRRCPRARGGGWNRRRRRRWSVPDELGLGVGSLRVPVPIRGRRRRCCGGRGGERCMGTALARRRQIVVQRHGKAGSRSNRTFSWTQCALSLSRVTPPSTFIPTPIENIQHAKGMRDFTVV